MNINNQFHPRFKDLDSSPEIEQESSPSQEGSGETDLDISLNVEDSYYIDRENINNMHGALKFRKINVLKNPELAAKVINDFVTFKSMLGGRVEIKAHEKWTDLIQAHKISKIEIHDEDGKLIRTVTDKHFTITRFTPGEVAYVTGFLFTAIRKAYEDKLANEANENKKKEFTELAEREKRIRDSEMHGTVPEVVVAKSKTDATRKIDSKKVKTQYLKKLVLERMYNEAKHKEVKNEHQKEEETIAESTRIVKEDVKKFDHKKEEDVRVAKHKKLISGG